MASSFHLIRLPHRLHFHFHRTPLDPFAYTPFKSRTISVPPQIHSQGISEWISHPSKAAAFQGFSSNIVFTESLGSGAGVQICAASTSPWPNTFFSLTVFILQLIFRSPWIIFKIFKKEQSLIAEVEEDVDKAAKFVKETAKFVEEVAEEVEKVSRLVEEDAEKVEDLLDKVKDNTKAMHEEIDEAVEALKKSAENTGKAQVKASAEKDVSSNASKSVMASNNLRREGPFWKIWQGQVLPKFLETGNGWIVVRAFIIVFLFIFRFHPLASLMRSRQVLLSHFL